MRSLLCIFFPHLWIHVTDIIWKTNRGGNPLRTGLYQCLRCKEISTGDVDPTFHRFWKKKKEATDEEIR